MKPQQMAARRVIIRGRVQGVWFRGFVRKHAVELGVNGWVRNRVDGTVEAEFTGDPNAIDQLVTHCRNGPPAARVEGLDAQHVPVPDVLPDTFAQLPTV